MKNTLALTKHLYNKDEVIYSLITSLLDKRDLKECYYWTFELYYSEIEIFPIIWKIYLDFYFVLNPRLESNIRRQHILWKKNPNNKNIAFIIKNLFKCNSCSDVFMLTQYASISDYPNYIYKGRKPKWLSSYPVDYHNWLRSIDKEHYENIVYYTKYILNYKSSKEIFENLVKYFAYKMEAEVDNGIYKFIETRMDGHDLHYILAMIVHLKKGVNQFTNKSIFRLPSKKELEWINDTQEYNIVCHKILNCKRLYEIDDNISYFKLARNDFHSMIDIFRFKWEYYAYNTPLWKKRIDTYNGIVNNKTQKIDFLNDEDLELFYETFGLEPDEQNDKVQNMSTKNITGKYNIFKILFKNPIIILPDNFKFLY